MTTRYRYDLERTYSGSEDSTHIELVVLTYEVVKTTAQGEWVRPSGDSYAKPRFVLRNARKKFAHADKKAALAAFIRRRDRQISILEHQLDEARRAYTLGRLRMERDFR